GPPLESKEVATGQVDVVSPGADGVVAASGRPEGQPVDSSRVRALGADGTQFEALWFNSHEAPLNDPLVREALMYAIDRQGLIDKLVKLLNPHAEVLDCGFLALPTSPQCRSQPFERFAYEPAKSLTLLEQAGYDCS